MTDHFPAPGKMVDLDALEKLAKSATPGEWRATDYTSEPAGGLGVAAPTSEVFVVNPAAIIRDQDARFIADANPSTILAMIRELRAAREVVRMYVDEPKERMEKMRAAGHVFHDEAEQQAIFEQTMDSIERDAAIGGEGPR